MIKISVIVPVYNMGEYLRECLESLKKQTYKELEIILVDDGSTDACPQICDEYAIKDTRIKVIHKENGGASSARNLGMKNATGDYITFVDPDDWLDPETFDECVKKIEKENVDVVRFNYVREFKEKSLIKENHILGERTYLNDECKQIAKDCIGLTGDKLSFIENNNILAPVWLNVYRRELIENHSILFFDIRKIGSFEDGLFNIEVYMNMKSFAYIDKAFYHYRKNNDKSNTNNYKKHYNERQKKLYEMIMNIISAEHDYYDAYCSRIVLSTVEICLNALKQNGTKKEKRKEINDIVNDPIRIEAYKCFEQKNLPLKWKIYHSFVKKRLTGFVYLMTSIIRKIQISR